MISKIAIFRALHLGDMLCITPTVRAIRHAWPDAEIFLIGLPWQRDLVVRFNHFFDHFIEFPGWPGLPEQKVDPEKVIAFLHHLRTFEFDLVFQMQGNGEITNSLCMLWGAKKVCGLRKPGEYAPIASLFPVSEDSDHEITRFMKLLKAVKVEPQGTDLEFPIFEDEVKRASAFLEKHGLRAHAFVCIHPGARDVRRRWPVQNFALIANQLITKGVPVVLTGSGEEETLLAELKNHIDGPVINLVESLGHITAGELGAILSRARLLVSNDTGVSHMAAALKTPSVIIFSPFSDYNRWHPLNTERHVGIPHEIAQDTSMVMAKIRDMLSSGVTAPSVEKVESETRHIPG